MQYVYIPWARETGCATVGFYDRSGAWIPESDHNTNEQAAERVHWLSGSTAAVQTIERTPEDHARFSQDMARIAKAKGGDTDQ